MSNSPENYGESQNSFLNFGVGIDLCSVLERYSVSGLSHIQVELI